MASWSEHLKAYGSEHGLNYSQAMNDEGCREAWRNLRESQGHKIKPRPTKLENIDIADPKVKAVDFYRYKAKQTGRTLKQTREDPEVKKEYAELRLKAGLPVSFGGKGPKRPKGPKAPKAE